MEQNKPNSYGAGLKFFHWQNGRAEGGYEIFPIIYNAISNRFGFDMFLLRYSSGARIQSHRDELHSFYSGARHFRLNIKLWHTGSGGEFICENILFRLGPIVLFRPDINTHSVTEVEGSRYLLSIGWKI